MLCARKMPEFILGELIWNLHWFADRERKITEQNISVGETGRINQYTLTTGWVKIRSGEVSWLFAIAYTGCYS